MAKDPVCGMEVDEDKASARTEHLGKSYSFCSPGCKEAFDKNPDQYVSGHDAGGHGGQH